jgi:three-Cys-motif partner protein
MAAKAPRSWGYWTEGKLDLLTKYLDAFTTATKKKARARVYLDAFAGEGRGRSRTTGGEFEGSARIGLNVYDPPFDRCYFFELPKKAAGLEHELTRDFPGRDLRVLSGDCNSTIPAALAELQSDNLDWAPTFAFLDPDGMQLRWETMQALAAHKLLRQPPGSKPRTKVELWVLLNSSGLIRNLALDEQRLQPGHVEKATALFGSNVWERIHRARQAEQISAVEAREQYVNLYRWQLEQQLDYRRTHPIEVKDRFGRPIYHLVFASDSTAGDDIMRYLYGKALTQWPKMREEARRRSAGGEQLALLGEQDSEATFPTKAYTYEPPVDPDGM